MTIAQFAVTTCFTTFDVLASNIALPPYAAVIEESPTGSAVVVNSATHI